MSTRNEMSAHDDWRVWRLRPPRMDCCALPLSSQTRPTLAEASRRRENETRCASLSIENEKTVSVSDLYDELIAMPMPHGVESLSLQIEDQLVLRLAWRLLDARLDY